MKPDTSQGEYKENKTTVGIGPDAVSYYEKARDRNGTWLRIGDTVRVVDFHPQQNDLRGMERKIIGIFQGDLMLGNERGGYDYCWPINVVKK